MIKSLRYILEGMGIYLLYGFCTYFPLGIVSSCGSRIARFIGPKLRVHQTALRNIERAFPDLKNEEKQTLALQMWDNLGRTAFEFIQIGRMNHKLYHNYVSVHGMKHFKSLQNSKKPIIFISGHLANWEVCPKTIAMYFNPVALVYRPANNPFANYIINNTRAYYQSSAIAKGKKGAKKLLSLIKNNQAVGVLLDQKMNDGIAVPFFGHEAMTAPAIANLALKYDCILVPIQVVRTQEVHFDVTIHPPLLLPDKEGTHTQRVKQILTDINAMFELWIRQNPSQWFWVHRRWKD